MVGTWNGATFANAVQARAKRNHPVQARRNACKRKDSSISHFEQNDYGRMVMITTATMTVNDYGYDGDDGNDDDDDDDDDEDAAISPKTD